MKRLFARSLKKKKEKKNGKKQDREEQAGKATQAHPHPMDQQPDCVNEKQQPEDVIEIVDNDDGGDGDGDGGRHKRGDAQQADEVIHLDDDDDDDDDDEGDDGDAGDAHQQAQQQRKAARMAQQDADAQGVPATAAKSTPEGDADAGVMLYAQLQSEAEAKRASSTGGTEASKPRFTQLPGTSSAPNAATVGQQSVRVGMKRLMKELKALRNSESVKNGVFAVDLDGDNLFEWDVKLFRFDEDSKLHRDLLALRTSSGIDNVWIRISFPSGFPFTPPFVRVLAPYVQGGFVLSGGAICMELLTPDGWSQAYRLEAVILQIMTTIARGGARVVKAPRRAWTEDTAKQAYAYLVKAHKKYGWRTPGLEEG